MLFDYRIKDFRKYAKKIEIINMPINNISNFIRNMQDKGYEKLTNRFLTKIIDNIKINISYNENEISSIIGYDQNDDITLIDSNILESIKYDIEECNN